MLAAYQLRYYDDSSPSNIQERLLFSTQFTVAGLQVGVVYRVEVRASTVSLTFETLWGPYAVLRVQDGMYMWNEVCIFHHDHSSFILCLLPFFSLRSGVELEVPTDVPTEPPTDTPTQPPTQPSTLSSSVAGPTQPAATTSVQQQTTSSSSLVQPSSTSVQVVPSSSSVRVQPVVSSTPQPVTSALLTPTPTPSVTLNPPTVTPSGVTAFVFQGTIGQILVFWRVSLHVVHTETSIH